MKVFQTVQDQFAILGIGPLNHPLNGKILVDFLLFGCIFASHTVYTYRVADSFMEYMTCIFSISNTFAMFVAFAAVVYRKTTLFKSLDDMGKLIDTSKMV